MAGEIGLGTLLLFDLDGQLVASSAFLNIPHTDLRASRVPSPAATGPARTRDNRQSEVSWLHRG
jgi:hypothetical protein